MPYASRRQQRWAHATRQPFARRWDKETPDFAALPEKKDAGTEAGPALHGPGGLLGMPGLSVRKWGKRKPAVTTKPMTPSEVGRAAALARWRGHAKKPQPPAKGRKPAKTEAERQAAQQQRRTQRDQERQAQRTQNRADVFRRMNIAPDGQAALEALRRGEQPDPAAIARGGFEAAGLVEQASDGSYRMTPAGRALMASAESGDAGRAGDTISGSRDRTTQRRTRQVEQAKRRQEAQQRRAGGGKKKKREPERTSTPMSAARRRRLQRSQQTIADAVRRVSERTKAYAPDRVLEAGHTGVMVALIPDAQAIAAIIGDEGVTESPEQLHLTLCYLGDSSETHLATNKARLIDSIAQWTVMHWTPQSGTINGVGRFFHAESDGTNAVYVAPDVPYLPTLRQSLVNWIERSGFDYSQDHGFTPHITVAYVAADAPTPNIRVETPVTFDRVVLAWGDEQYDFPVRAVTEVDRLKSFTVYKDHTGAHRWLARSTTAYRDRDREILPIATLDADSQRMTASKQFGPLRWWHLGAPDPFNVTAPWGSGLDIGDCDFSTQIGTTRVESGTFRDGAVAARIAATADQYELSPGFFHGYGESGPPDGIYQQLRTFERSLVPTRYGRASNLFTGLTVKEHRMDPQEMERRFKAAIAELRLSPEQAEQLASGIVQTDKSAQAQGVTYKSDDAPQVFTAPDGTQGIIHEGRFVALKAAMPPAEMEEAGETELEDGAVERAFLGDMDPGEYMEQMKAMLAPALKMDQMLKAFSDGFAELKSMLGGVATKDAGTVARITQLESELAALRGDRPRVVEPDALAALKSTGPQAPPDPSAPQLPADASPLTQLAARTMPALYSNEPNGQFHGWGSPAPLPPQS